jgi:hypothetical protein
VWPNPSFQRTLRDEAVEKPFLNRKIIPEWRDPNRAIHHFID